jgi:protein-L-isoaspartate(D-aspartate) O-methyltransferase
MIREAFVKNAKALGVRDERILKLLSTLPREKFLPKKEAAFAFLDQPLPIGEGQTCSQPSLVAFMVSLLNLSKEDTVLEIGTGSGYQTAFLAQLAKQVYTIERLKSLSLQAQKRLSEMGYQNIEFKLGDGVLGWPQKSPFSGIILSAGLEKVPPALFQQLAEGGRLIAPVGPAGHQILLAYLKKGAKITCKEYFPVAFVPIISENL